MSEVESKILRDQKHDLEAILKSEEGRRFVWRLLSYCGVYRDVVGEQEIDIFKQLGRRQVGLYLLGICSDTAEDKVFLMMREAKEYQEEIDYARRIENTKRELSERGEPASFDRGHVSGIDEYI